MAWPQWLISSLPWPDLPRRGRDAPPRKGCRSDRMDVKITQQKDNALMARKDIAFQVTHPGETTPSRT